MTALHDSEIGLLTSDDALHMAKPVRPRTLCGLRVEDLAPLPMLADGTPDLHGIAASKVCDECWRGGRRSTIIGPRGAYRVEYGDGTLVQVGEPDRLPCDWVSVVPVVLSSIGFLLAVVAVLMAFDAL